MKISVSYCRSFICPVIIAFLSGVCFSQMDSDLGTDNSGKNFWEKQTIKAEVTKVDKNNNEVTLKGPKDKEVTLVIDKNLDLRNVKEGDSVTAEFFRSVAIQVSKPTPQQEKEPYTILESKKIAPAGVELAGGRLRQIKALTTVKKVDMAEKQIVIEGLKGNEITLSVTDKNMLEKVKKGEKAVITYTEAMATKLEKTK